MAKFNKDRFINDMTDKVQTAINTHLISKEDYDSQNKEVLHNFIQYELVQSIKDRKFAVDVVSDFNYDEKAKWSEIGEEGFGVFESLKDVALYNLWKFLEAEGSTEYTYYKPAELDSDASMLDIARSVATDDEAGNPIIDRDFGGPETGSGEGAGEGGFGGGEKDAGDTEGGQNPGNGEGDEDEEDFPDREF